MRQVQRGRKSFFWLLSTLMTLALTGFLVMPAQAADPANPADPVPNTNRGTIEICKSSRFGMAGRPFQFTISTSSGTSAPFTVFGGGCSGPISTPAGLNTVVEAPTKGLQVFAITSRHVISKDLATGTIVVRVKAFSTPADERLVTYVNQPIPADGLKVCKSAATDSPSLVGQPFSFTENGGPAYSVLAGTVAAPNCGPVTPYQLGTDVDVAELATPGTHVSDITVSDNRGSNFDTAAGTVTATIGSGVTIVTYTNAVTIGRPDGFIEVCKSAGDGYVRGSFDFTITDAGGVVGIQSVAVGQCSPPVKVRSGNVTVTEAARSPYYVSAIFVVPQNRLVSSNLSNRTVTVTVPKGDEGTETTVTFENSTRTGQIKVCKTLTRRSEGLAGYKFYFDVTDVNGTHTLSVVAGPRGLHGVRARSSGAALALRRVDHGKAGCQCPGREREGCADQPGHRQRPANREPHDWKWRHDGDIHEPRSGPWKSARSRPMRRPRPRRSGSRSTRGGDLGARRCVLAADRGPGRYCNRARARHEQLPPGRRHRGRTVQREPFDLRTDHNPAKVAFPSAGSETRPL